MHIKQLNPNVSVKKSKLWNFPLYRYFPFT